MLLHPQDQNINEVQEGKSKDIMIIEHNNNTFSVQAISIYQSQEHNNPRVVQAFSICPLQEHSNPSVVEANLSQEWQRLSSIQDAPMKKRGWS